jgi:hypothetical protein
LYHRIFLEGNELPPDHGIVGILALEVFKSVWPTHMLPDGALTLNYLAPASYPSGLALNNVTVAGYGCAARHTACDVHSAAYCSYTVFNALVCAAWQIELMQGQSDCASGWQQAPVATHTDGHPSWQGAQNSFACYRSASTTMLQLHLIVQCTFDIIDGDCSR